MNLRGTFTQVPNRYYQLLPKIKLSTQSVLQIFFRQAYGFHKDFAFISRREFAEMTGMSLGTVDTAIKDALSNGYLHLDKSQKGANGKSCYRIGYKFFIDSDWYKNRIDSIIERKAQIDLKSIHPPLQIDLIFESIEAQIDLKSIPHINKELLKEKKEEIKNTSRDARANAFSALVKHLQQKQDNSIMPDEPINLDELFDDIPDTEPEFEDPDLVTDFTNTPFTQEEYNWFVGRKICSVELLTHFVYNPIHFQDGYGDDAIDCRPYWDDRTSLERDEIKQLSDWNKTVGLVQHYLNVVTPGEATKYAQQFTGRAKKGEWKDWNIKPALNVIELCAFLHWLSEMKARDPQFRPKKPEKLFMLVEEFRALPNHFEHVNYARYQIKQVFPKPQEPVEIDLTLGPEDEMKKLSEQFEAEFGFSLSGSFG